VDDIDEMDFVDRLGAEKRRSLFCSFCLAGPLSPDCPFGPLGPFLLGRVCK